MEFWKQSVEQNREPHPMGFQSGEFANVIIPNDPNNEKP